MNVPVPTGGWQPVQACEPVLDRRVTRLSDKHLSHAMGDLLEIPRPELESGALSTTAFLPGKAAAVTAAVAAKLQDVIEAVARQATQPGKPAVACVAAEPECARTFIDQFASRAFRRPITDTERAELLAVYEAGRGIEGQHAGAVALVIEAVLQSPSFLYLAELGVRAGGLYRLTGHELAAKLSFFLRDTIPDDALWRAAAEGRLDTEAGLAAEVERMLALPEVRTSLSRMFFRFLDIESLPELDKGEVPEWPALSAAMYAEATRLVDDVLWRKNGTLADLLTSREAAVDKTLAALYGVTHPGGTATVEVTLPADRRAGILTRAGIMAVNADENESSVIFRGLLVARGFLCVEPPPPDDAAMTLGEIIRKEVPTERGRAEKRLTMAECAGCHRLFDPFGVMFENYDAIGRFRTAVHTPQGEVPVDASWDIKLADIEGRVEGPVDLSQRLGASRAARECIVQQIGAYAVGQRLEPGQTCALGQTMRRFETSGGKLQGLVKDIATWPGLRMRREGVAP